MSQSILPSAMTEEVKVFKRILWDITLGSKAETEAYRYGFEIISPKFDVKIAGNVSSWCLMFYPNGESLETEGRISLFLNLVSAGSTNFTAMFTLGIVESEGRNYSGADLKMDSEVFSSIPGFGLDLFIPHEKLFDPSSGLISSDGNISLICDLTLVYTRATAIYNAENLLYIGFYSDYQKMFFDESFSDFNLMTSDGVILKTHKVILSARSPVFYAMLKSDMQEAKNGCANVPDFDSKVMEEVLRFIYYNKVEELENIARILVYAAEKYQLEKLKEVCLESIIETMTVENVVESFVISGRVSNATKLYEKCIDLIISNFRDVFRGPAWKMVPIDLVRKFTEEALLRANTIRI